MTIRTLAMALALGAAVTAVTAMTGCAGNRGCSSGACGCSGGSCSVPSYAGSESYNSAPYGGGSGAANSYGSGTR